MTTNNNIVWLQDTPGQDGDFKTMHTYVGDGNPTRSFEINFSGGYLYTADVKAYMRPVGTAEYEYLTPQFVGPNTLRFNKAVPVGYLVTIYRDTGKELPIASFEDGALVTANSLNLNSKQAIFGVAEMVDRFASTQFNADESLNISNEALLVAEEAKEIAESAVETVGTVDRVIRAPIGEYITPLPEASLRANTTIAFNAEGDLVTQIPASGSAADVMIQLANSGGAGLVGTVGGSTVQTALDGLGNDIAGVVGDLETQRGELTAALNSHKTALSSASGGSLVGVGTGIAGFVRRTLDARLKDVISVADFGAVGDGNTDCTAAITAALAYVSSKGRGVLYFPAGVWSTSGSFTVPTNCVIVGAGIGASQIKYTGVNKTLFTIGTTATNPNNVYIRDIHILVTTTHTSGNLIRITNGYNCGLQDVRIDGPWYDCVQLIGGAQQFIYRIDKCIINGESTSNNNIIIGDATSLVQDTFLTDLVLGGALRGCQVLEQFSSGVYATNVDCLNAKNGWAWIPASSACYCKGSFYTAILGDTTFERGLVIDPPTNSYVVDLNFNGCWASSCGTTKDHAGLYINGEKGAVRNLNFNGITCVNNKGNGIQIIGTKVEGINITNPDCSNNSQIGSAQAHGISIGAGVFRINICNGHSGATTGLGNNLQGYGVFVAGGNGHSISITGMDLANNVSGPLNFGATGSYNRIEGCTPMRSRMKGSVQIPNGASSVTVNPGVFRNFTGSDVQVTNTTDMGSRRFWVEASGNSFTIKTDAALTNGLWFSWAVDVSYS